MIPKPTLITPNNLTLFPPKKLKKVESPIIPPTEKTEIKEHLKLEITSLNDSN